MTAGMRESVASSVYFDRRFGCEAVKLLPGEYFVTDRDIALVTTLGSCVSACIRDRVTGVGGMNHFMLPEVGLDAGNPAATSARYGAYAMEVLINDLLKRGAKRANLEAKVFGGGNVLDGLTLANVGERNAAFVLGFLALENIPLAARDLLGANPRKVCFFPRTGRVLVRKLGGSGSGRLVTREADYLHSLRGRSVSGDVELFT